MGSQTPSFARISESRHLTLAYDPMNSDTSIPRRGRITATFSSHRRHGSPPSGLATVRCMRVASSLGGTEDGQTRPTGLCENYQCKVNVFRALAPLDVTLLVCTREGILKQTTYLAEILPGIDLFKLTIRSLVDCMGRNLVRVSNEVPLSLGAGIW